jgi:hypothetical protein
LRSRTLWTTPIALADEEAASDDAGVHLARLSVDKVGLGLEHCARATFVVDADDLLAGFKFAAVRRSWEGLQEFDLALAIDNARVVEFGDIRNLNGIAGLVVVDYLLGVLLEGCGRLMIGPRLM